MKVLKEKAKKLDAQLRIGKNGLGEGMVEEIKSQLKKKKLVKIKFLRAYSGDKDRKEEAKKIAMLTGGEIVYLTGNVFVLWKQ